MDLSMRDQSDRCVVIDVGSDKSIDRKEKKG